MQNQICLLFRICLDLEKHQVLMRLDDDL